MSKSVACVAHMHRLFLLNLGWFLGGERQGLIFELSV